MIAGPWSSRATLRLSVAEVMACADLLGHYADELRSCGDDLDAEGESHGFHEAAEHLDAVQAAAQRVIDKRRRA